MFPAYRWLPAVCAAGLLASACEDDERRNARELLERIQTVDIQEPHEQREPQIAALRKMPLHEKRLVEIRDVCVKAHEALLEAEEYQARARRVIEAADGDAAAEAAAPVAQDLERSEAALKQAKALFPRCEHETRDLALRFER